MMKVLVFRETDGSLSIMTPLAPGRRNPGEPARPVTEERLKDLKIRIEKSNPDIEFIGAIEKKELPRGRNWRNQWRVVDGKVSVDMPLARKEKMRQIREERDKRLATTDGPWLRAQETRDIKEQQELGEKRQVLRQIPQNTDLESIKTPEELEAFEPEWPE
jgi:hypothetical protein